MRTLAILAALGATAACKVDTRSETVKATELMQSHRSALRAAADLVLGQDGDACTSVSWTIGLEALCPSRGRNGAIVSTMRKQDGLRIWFVEPSLYRRHLERRAESQRWCSSEPGIIDLGEGWFAGRSLGVDGSAAIRGRVTASRHGLDLILRAKDRQHLFYVQAAPEGEFCKDDIDPGVYELWIGLERIPTGDQPYPASRLIPSLKLQEYEMRDVGQIRLPGQLPVQTVEVQVNLPNGSPAVGSSVAVNTDSATVDDQGLARVVALRQPSYVVVALLVEQRFWFWPHRKSASGVAIAGQRLNLVLQDEP